MSEPVLPTSHRGFAEETVTLTIDDKEVTVPKGTLIIRAAEKLGIVIPRFCDHPLLTRAGACRQCAVEVEGQGKPVMSCTMDCEDEMVVKTHLTSQLAKEAQVAQLEFLLINHPLDCPMCDKGGECPLQDQALAYGPGESRFVDEKRRYEKPVALSPNVLLDRERCVLCARCTRFAREISGRPFVELFERGALQQVAMFEDEPYFDYFSGNIIQICPVGALTSASYRFRARPFDLESRPSVCNLCSAGCTHNVHSRRGGVMRQVARTNMDVNEMWNCDKGRFGFKYLEHELRLTEPAVRKQGDLLGVSWTEALEKAADALRRAAPGRVAVLTGGRLADEDAYTVAKYARTVLETDDLDFRTRTAGRDEDANLAVVVSRPGATYRDVEYAPVTLLVDLDPEEEVPILHLRLRKAWLKNDAKLVAIGPRAGTISEILWRRLRCQPGSEAAVLHALAERLEDGSGDEDDDLDAVAGALREAGGDVVVLVGERGAATPGALAAAGRLTDALDAKLAWVPRRNNARGALNAGLLAGLLPGGYRLEVPDEREVVEAVWGELPDGPGRGLREILEAAASGEIDVLHLIGVDLARDCDRPRLAKAALERVPTVIVQDLLRTETVRYAHVVLPAMGAQERAGTYTNWEGRRQRFWRAVPAPTLVQEDWNIITQLVSFLGHHLGFSDLDGIRADMARIGSVAPREWPSPEDSPAAPRRQEDGDGERLPEGRLHLLTYPLLLDRGVMSLGADDMLKTAKGPFAALNVADARRLGVSDGQTITLASDYGRLTLTARVEDDVVQDVVYLPSNSTEEPAATLAGALAGPVWVTVEPVDARVASMFGGGLSTGPTTEPFTRGDSGLPREGGPW